MIAQDTLTQYQRELDAGVLTEDILSKKLENPYETRKNRNYNHFEKRQIIEKSGWKGKHGVDSGYAHRVPHWAQLRENGRKLATQQAKS